MGNMVVPEHLTFDSLAFKDFKLKLNCMLDELITEMAKKGIDSGRIRSKINITLNQKEDISGNELVIFTPYISFDVNGSYQVDAKDSGEFGGIDYEIAFGDEGWMLCNSSDGQMSFNIDD